jgi:hypothetical protein
MVDGQGNLRHPSDCLEAVKQPFWAADERRFTPIRFLFLFSMRSSAFIGGLNSLAASYQRGSER